MSKEELDARVWEIRISLLRLAGSILRHPQNAEDAVSQAIVTAYQRLDTLQDDAALKPWLMKITARCCFEQIRKQRRESVYEEPALMEKRLFAQGPQPTLYDILMQLPSHLAQVLALYYYEGYSTAEIGALLELSRPTVSMRLSRGRRQLKKLLLAEEQETEGDEQIEAAGI